MSVRSCREHERLACDAAAGPDDQRGAFDADVELLALVVAHVVGREAHRRLASFVAREQSTAARAVTCGGRALKAAL